MTGVQTCALPISQEKTIDELREIWPSVGLAPGAMDIAVQANAAARVAWAHRANLIADRLGSDHAAMVAASRDSSLVASASHADETGGPAKPQHLVPLDNPPSWTGRLATIPQSGDPRATLAARREQPAGHLTRQFGGHLTRHTDWSPDLPIAPAPSPRMRWESTRRQSTGRDELVRRTRT